MREASAALDGRTAVSFSPATSRVGDEARISTRETPDLKPSTNARRNARRDEARRSALPSSSIPIRPLNKAVTGRVWRKGDSTNRYKLAKQADVLMLIYLLGPDELIALLDRLGYEVAPDALARTVEYYLARTAHGSTLSRVVHASVLARLDRSRAWSVFREALDADLDDTQGGTTREGVHLGAMAGTVDLVLRAFAGLQIGHDALTFDPRLPEGLRRVGFQLQYRGQRIDVSLDHERLRLTAQACNARPVRIRFAGALVSLAGGQTRELDLRASS